jgi:Ca2+-binding EF-hand superfamily protein
LNHFLCLAGLKDAFALFDRLGDGTIRTRDLAFVMRSIGYQTTPSELERMIREVDQDGRFEMRRISHSIRFDSIRFFSKAMD